MVLPVVDANIDIQAWRIDRDYWLEDDVKAFFRCPCRERKLPGEKEGAMKVRAGVGHPLDGTEWRNWLRETSEWKVR